MDLEIEIDNQLTIDKHKDEHKHQTITKPKSKNSTVMLEVQRTSSSSFSSPIQAAQIPGPAAAIQVPPSAPVPTSSSASIMAPQHQHQNQQAPFNPMASVLPSSNTTNGITTSTITNGFNNPSSSSSAALPPPTRESVLQRLSEALLRRSLAKIDLSQKGLGASDARLVKMAILQNRQLRVLKLGYNQLGDSGLQTLTTGIAKHTHLQSIDLGFNNISDIGCQALAQAMLTQTCQIQTLYLAGNSIGHEGAMALADVIRRPSALERLYMTGNRLGSEGVKALTEAILEEAAIRRSYPNNNTNSNTSTNAALRDQTMMTNNDDHATNPTTTNSTLNNGSNAKPSSSSSHRNGMQELFLGGTGLGAAGCQAIARLLASPDCRLKVLSLANCDLTDEEITRQDGGIALAIKGNRDNLPLKSLQLSFNAITHKGLEALMNALWGSRTLQELRIDNNDIGDRGAQQIAAILPYLKTLETLDVGFNNINNKNHGMKILMKAVAETNNLKTLSLSGNPMQDVSSAKAVAYALAYNTSLQSLLVVHCHLTTEGQRHVAAGAVSNSRTSVREVSGFPIGPVIVTLGFPDALEHWTNEQVLNFIHLMWNKTKAENGKSEHEDERGLDPLNFLPGSAGSDNKPGRRSGPLEATIVVDVARKAFASLVANGRVDVFSRRPGHPNAMTSPAVFAPRDAIMLESVDGDSIVESMGEVAVSSTPTTSSNNLLGPLGATGSTPNGAFLGSAEKHHMNGSTSSMASAKKQARSFVAPPQERSAAKHSQLPDPSRKKRIVEWLCSNIKHLNKMAQVPFDSSELLRLHQHYFTPVVNESGGTSVFNNRDSAGGNSVRSSHQAFSAAGVPLGSAIMEEASVSSSTTMQSGDVNMVPLSDPMFTGGQELRTHNRPQQRSGQPQQVASSLPMLKRKVSYRFLGDAAMHQQSSPHQQHSSPWSNAFGGGSHVGSVSKMIQDGPSGHSLPPKNKKARRNRTRISFLPRVKAKLDSYLDVCHEKALITMRQLYYVEQAILSGQVNPLEEGTPRTHLSGPLATDAETIVVDMM
ncbi:leucine Rich Repeat [Seminavis robusta]|uniref:Leucine Rich Repeat n=1 Tax=Seminavis robusta TaxID=568900 RepID=A0A9N8DPY1_9STRA|nr:leucine Rich Repeat [Seminavis robusta]|eukprot:Sro201_g085250.1 leucine Rich Repeat (1047) ;mRNA; r:85832-89093